MYHYKCSGYKAGFEEIQQAEALKTCVHKCNEAQSHKDWNKLLIETQNVLSLGADSATEVRILCRLCSRLRIYSC